MNRPLDLIGIGIGPFNLSLAALLEKVPEVQSLFLERKPHFDWHPEVMFADSTMQTTYLKDLVTPVDPTNPHSFLNYMVERGLFYSFLNTQRSVISRREFQQYCCWVTEKIGQRLRFNSQVREISFDQNSRKFQVRTDSEIFHAPNVCVATGMELRIPDSARPLIGPRVFHAKSPQLAKMDLTGKSLLIVGGGQTGIEIFSNALHGKWGHANEIKIITRRNGLEPLDESAFTNDLFTPNYVGSFWDLSLERKQQIVASQKLASDGNTPHFLLQLYNDLYRFKHVENDPRNIRILACRKLMHMSESDGRYQVVLENTFHQTMEEISADIVVLSTGFESSLPKVLEPLFPKIAFDEQRRFRFKKSYALEWDGPAANRIYALNYSRHNHGIVDPQTSLMAWRSAVVVNDLLGESRYATDSKSPNFIDYGEPSR